MDNVEPRRRLEVVVPCLELSSYDKIWTDKNSRLFGSFRQINNESWRRAEPHHRTIGPGTPLAAAGLKIAGRFVIDWNVVRRSL